VTTGYRVFHSKLGWGTVLRVVEYGKNTGAWVDFGYTKEFVKQEDLRLADPKATKPSAAIKPSRLSPIKPVEPAISCTINQVADCRRGILALRLGQVIESHVFRLSVGTDKLEEALGDAIKKARKGLATFLMVEGAWGGGKTHALTLLQAMARKERFATSSVVMDGDAVSLADPMQLMEEVLSSFCFPGQGNADQLMDLVRRVVREERLPEIRLKGAEVIASALAGVPRKAFDDAEALGLLQDYFSLALSASQAKAKIRQLGYRVALPTLRAFRVDERVVAFQVLLKNWALLASAMGSKGLLVLIDELDVEYAATAYDDRASLERREKRTALLQEMLTLTGQKVPLLVAFASAPAGSDLARQNDAVEDVLGIFGAGLLHLKVPVPSEAALAEMLRRLSSFYLEAYPDSRDRINESVVEALFQGLLQRYRKSSSAVPRQFVRTVLEALDLLTVGEMSCEGVLRILRGSL
jgi:hypothetical protein